jgi:hypothetical protein
MIWKNRLAETTSRIALSHFLAFVSRSLKMPTGRWGSRQICHSALARVPTLVLKNSRGIWVIMRR